MNQIVLVSYHFELKQEVFQTINWQISMCYGKTNSTIKGKPGNKLPKDLFFVK